MRGHFGSHTGSWRDLFSSGETAEEAIICLLHLLSYSLRNTVHGRIPPEPLISLEVFTGITSLSSCHPL